MNQGGRNIAIDLAKGVGILLMILGHMEGLRHILHALIYRFHMPLFFFLAGCVFKVYDTNSLVRKSAAKFLLPWGIVLCVEVVLLLLMGDNGLTKYYAQGFLFPEGTRQDAILLSGMGNSGAIWFLPALFWCRIVYNLMAKKLSGLSLLLVSITIGLGAGLFGRYCFNLPFGMLMGLSGLVYFSLGSYMKEMASNFKKIPWYVILLFLLFWMLYERCSNFEMFAFNYDVSYVVDVVIATMTSYVCMYVCMYGERMEMWLSPLAWMGRNSLIILCCHTIALLFRHRIIFLDNGYLALLINFVVTIGMTYIIVSIKSKWKIANL
ncbi:MAG: acyltransferase family protein [Agathobacter sp.]